MNCFLTHLVKPRAAVLVLIILSLTATVFAQPVISSLSPVAGPVGAHININGSGFNAVAGNNTVYLGAARATVVSATANTIVVSVPTGTSNMPVTVTNNGLTGYSKLPFNVSFPGDAPLHAGSFAGAVNIPSTGYIYNLASADLDNDGSTDLLTVHNTGREIKIYRNNSTAGSVNLVNTLALALGSPAITLKVADFDGDGKTDIVAADFSLDSLYVFRNISVPGTIAMEPKKGFKLLVNASAIEIADMDLDGKPDLVIAGSAPGALLVAANTTTGSNISFTGGTPVGSGSGRYLVAVADIDGNGKPDIISAQVGNLVVIVNESGPGNLQFASSVSFPLGGEIISLATGDLDNDGNVDVVAGKAIASPGSSIAVCRNSSTPNNLLFEAPLILPTGLREIWSLTVMDMDGDNRADIVYADMSNSIKGLGIFRNNGTATIGFDNSFEYGTGVRYRSVATADLTNDGKPDIALVSHNQNILSVFKNKIGEPPVISSFSPASAGEGILVTINGSNLSATNSVSFGGVSAASYTVVSDIKITAVPAAAGASGDVSVTTTAGTASLAGFTFNPRPVISSFSPASARQGDIVRITGNNFIPLASGNIVYMGAAKATVMAASSTTLDVRVPAGATYQPITIISNGYTIQSQQSFHLIFANGYLSDTSFKNRYSPATGGFGTSYNASIVDIDGDGKNDVIVNVHASSFGFPPRDSIGVYRNTSANGQVSFAAKASFFTNSDMAQNVYYADLNGDGKPDVLVPNDYFNGNGSLRILQNTSSAGSISFGLPTILSTGGETTNISIADIDGDGRLDISIACGYNFVDVYRNSSSSTVISFENKKTFALPPDAGGSFASWLGDVDGDGKPDLAAVYKSLNSFGLFLNTSTPGNIDFAVRRDINTGYGGSYVTMGDLDKDGKNEVIIGAGYYNNKFPNTPGRGIVIMHNQSTVGNIAFAGSPHVIPYTPWNIVLSDLNGDDRVDLAAANSQQQQFSVFENTSTPGQLSFSAANQYPVSYIQLAGMDAGDLDGDARPDLVIAEHNSAVFVLYINQNTSELRLCPGGTATIYAGLTGGSYQWQVDTGSGFVNIINNINYSGATTSALTLINIPSAWKDYKYRCKVNQQFSKITTLKFVNTWTGALSTAWENPGNWSCGSVPDINTQVIINTGTVEVNSDIIISSLTLSPGVQVTVNAPYVITIIP